MASKKSTTPRAIIKVFSHEGHDISVPFTGDAYFNATAAAKPFNTKPDDWLRTDEAKKYVEALAKKCELEQNQLVIVKNGAPSTGGGTWMHPKLGIMFARWLSIDFALWADDQIEAILRNPIRNAVTPELVNHMRREHQVTNAKHINGVIYHKQLQGEVFINFPEYHRQVCTVLSDHHDTPHQIKERARLAGANSYDRSSGRQAMRYLEPATAAAASLNDSLVVHGAQTSDALRLSQQSKSLFSGMLAIGLIPAELLAADLA